MVTMDLMRVRQERVREGDVTVEAEVKVMQLTGQEPRIASSL